MKLGGEALTLYNLANDPGEQNDLATASPERASRAAEIMREGRTPSEHFPLFED